MIDFDGNVALVSKNGVEAQTTTTFDVDGEEEEDSSVEGISLNSKVPSSFPVFVR